MSAPEISAKVAVVYDLTSQQYIYTKNAERTIPPASTLKLLTAMVILDKWMPDQSLSVPSSVSRVSPFKLYLRKGEKYTVLELLHALLLRSANDVAHVLAVRTKGSEQKFSKAMNQKAKMLGIKHSSFRNPHGLPDKSQYTTAKDMALIVAGTLNYPLIQKILKTKTSIFPGPGEKKTKLISRNKLLISGFTPEILGKTGYTKKAGRCFAGYSTNVRTPVVIILMKSNYRWKDLEKLAKWSAKFYLIRISQNKKILHKQLVTACQKRLKELKLLNGKVDGIFGTQTQAAILRFQNMNNLKVDGIAGKKTLKALKL